MGRILSLLRKIYVPLLFILLEVMAINYYLSSTSYTKAKAIASSNAIFGSIQSQFSSIGSYFHLRGENKMLLSEVSRLQDQLMSFSPSNTSHDGDQGLSLRGDSVGIYHYIPATVLRNSVLRRENFIVLDRGARDGVRVSNAVVTPSMHIVGYVLEVSERFSVVISVLNTKFYTGGGVSGKDYFGSIFWTGFDNDFVTLSEIPKHADIAVGDSVVTGYSSIFPSGISIGTIESFELIRSTFFDAQVRLSTDLSRIGSVLIVDYADLEERQMLEGLYFAD